MTEHYRRLVDGDPVVLAHEDLRSSSESVDRSECTASVVYPGERVHELWVTSRFVMPSGQVYEVDELTWTPEGDGYLATFHGRGAR